MIEFPVSEKQGIARQLPASGDDREHSQLALNMSAKNAIIAIDWVEITLPADSLYQHLLLTAEKKFWRCVESGAPRIFGVEPPRPARTEHPHPWSPPGLFRMEAAPV